jgi:MoaA/NifB/PqqE/SkfB family radical SAM enzyme/predicted alpha/beta hydrolase family esterase
MSVGIVLVHGYSGSKRDLSPLADKLIAGYGEDSVRNISLPGHEVGRTPNFDRQLFVDFIFEAVNDFLKQNREIILIGHSTGGILILTLLFQKSFNPQFLVLAGVPKKIDTGYIERWNTHSSQNKDISFSSVAGMVSLINSVGSKKPENSFPVFIIHGENDKLVPYQEAFAWKDKGFEGPVHSVIIPSGEHDLFCGKNGAVASDVAKRAVDDYVYWQQKDDKKTVECLSDVETGIGDFLAVSPFSSAHLEACPSGRRVAGKILPLLHIAENGPVFANIEITTRCNLNCRYCARSLLGRQDRKDMSLNTFRRILELLPHAYRVTLVGLGEPLLHPGIIDFVDIAGSMGRRVGIVTNAMCLDRSISRELLKAGLDSMTFSIDAADQEVSSNVRAGTDFNRVIKNVKGFMDVGRKIRAISKAVFSAVSISTVFHLKRLIEVVAGLGVDVLMLTDLNYKQNEKDTLWKNIDDKLVKTVNEAVRYAFSKQLPVLSVRGLEAFGLAKLYKDFLMIPPSKIYERSNRHAQCFSPWQTVPVDVEGNVTVCDCQPDNVTGNLLSEPFTDIWNGSKMVEFRKKMLGEDPPEVCRICPRF